MDLDNEELKYARKANGTDRDIEVGDYVRTLNKGIFIISHINVYFDDSYFNKVLICQNEKVSFTNIDTINDLKHSKNIIDLIEVGDVLEIYFPIKKITKKVFVDEYFKDSLILDGIIQKRINLKKILTKEQYNQNCYRLEE